VESKLIKPRRSNRPFLKSCLHSYCHSVHYLHKSPKRKCFAVPGPLLRDVTLFPGVLPMILAAVRRNSRQGKEQIGGCRLNEVMSTTVTATTHAASGRILKCITFNQIDEPDRYAGSLPTDWIDPPDHARVKLAIAVAAKGGSPGACKYLLSPALYGGKAWQVETIWSYNPSDDAPVIGLSRTVLALPPLTAKELELVRELANATQALGRNKSTTRSARWRLAKKLGVDSSQLAAFCRTYADIL
jgi:hypothetical protein